MWLRWAVLEMVCVMNTAHKDGLTFDNLHRNANPATKRHSDHLEDEQYG